MKYRGIPTVGEQPFPILVFAITIALIAIALWAPWILSGVR